jgi:outer membrane protein W
MTNYNYKRLLCATALLTGLCGGSLVAGDVASDDDFINSSRSQTRMTTLLPSNDTTTSTKSPFNFISQYVNKDKGLDEKTLKISGVTRFLTIYRQMDESYLDMINGDKNFSFSDYPVANAGTSQNGGYPMLELNLQSKLASNFDFSVGYSMGHSFTGNVTEGVAQSTTITQNLNFRASHRASMLKSTVYAGEVLWTNLSRFTMGQPEYRDNYFERLPWDWYRKSFTRYQEYYSLSSNIGQQQLGRAPLQGFIAELEWLPMQVNFKALYGRTNTSVALSSSLVGFPSITQGFRLEKVIFERQIRGVAGLNFYQKRAQTAITGGIKDYNTIGAFDFALKVLNKVNISGEFGYGKIENPYYADSTVINGGDDGSGAGGVLKFEFDKRAVLWPFSVEYYYIHKNLVSVDGSIINSNTNMHTGGYNTELIYDATLMGNVSNEVGQLANNRSGVNLKLEATLKDFRVQFGYSASQELTNISDTITMQHRVNAFSRSRFRPWFQAGGPYGRIKSNWFRTFETIDIGNEFYNPNQQEAIKKVGTEIDSIAGSNERALLGFNTIELLLKYKKKIGKKHEIVLLNFSSINTVKEGFNAFSNIDDNTYTSLLFNDFTVAFKLTEKVSLVGNYAIERFKGSERTNLSPDVAAAYEDLDNPTVASNTKQRIIDQTGQAYAAGVDYDFNKTTSLHLRTKYMTHEDKNFTRDKFSGYETTFELKIFF